MSWSLLIFLTCVCLLLEAFFSGSELALVAADKSKLSLKARQGDRGAQRALSLMERPEVFFSTTLLGQSLFIVANSMMLSFFILDHFGRAYEIWGLLLSPLILIFGEAVPKGYFQQNADRLAPQVAFWMRLVSYIFIPIVWPLSQLTKFLLGETRGESGRREFVTTESVENLFKDTEIFKDILPVFRKSLPRIFGLSRSSVMQVMTPLADVFSLPAILKVEEATLLCHEEQYSAVPVYQGRKERIVGILHVEDLLLSASAESIVSDLMEAPVYVPSGWTVKEVFLFLKAKGRDFATVMDLEGRAVGIVTLEDLIEEVVGEIEDEYDAEKS